MKARPTHTHTSRADEDVCGDRSRKGAVVQCQCLLGSRGSNSGDPHCLLSEAVDMQQLVFSFIRPRVECTVSGCIAGGSDPFSSAREEQSSPGPSDAVALLVVSRSTVCLLVTRSQSHQITGMFAEGGG